MKYYRAKMSNYDVSVMLWLCSDLSIPNQAVTVTFFLYYVLVMHTQVECSSHMHVLHGHVISWS